MSFTPERKRRLTLPPNFTVESFKKRPVESIHTISQKLDVKEKTQLALNAMTLLKPPQIQVVTERLLEGEKKRVDDKRSEMKLLKTDQTRFSVDDLGDDFIKRCPIAYAMVKGLIANKESDARKVVEGDDSNAGKYNSTCLWDLQILETDNIQASESATLLMAMIAGMRNRKQTGFKGVMSLGLYADGARGTSFDLLSKLGATVTSRGVVKLIRNVAQSKKACDSSRQHQPYSHIFPFDNVNLYRRTYQESVTHRSTMANYTICAAVPIVHDNPSLSTEPQRPVAEFDIWKLMPTQKEQEHFMELFKLELKELLLLRFRAFHHLKKHRPKMEPENTIVVSNITGLGMLEENEGSNDGAAKVIAEIMDMVGVSEEYEYEVPFTGDQLTIDRIRSAKALAQMNFFGSKKRRFKCVQAYPSDFHFRMELQRLIYDCFLGHRLDFGCLNNLASLVDRRLNIDEKTGGPKIFNVGEEFLQDTFIAFAEALFCTVLNISSPEDTADINTFRRLNINSEDGSEGNTVSIAHIDQLLDMVFKEYFQDPLLELKRAEAVKAAGWEYASTNRRSLTNIMRNQADFDDVYYYAIQLMSLSGFYFVVKRIIRHGRGTDSITAWKLANILFIGAGKRNYYKEATRMLIGMNTYMSERLAYIMTHNRTLNTDGQAGNHQEVDFLVEKLVLRFKLLERTAMTNSSFEWSDILAIAGDFIWDVRNCLKEELDLTCNSSHHSDVDRKEDINLMRKRILEEEMFSKKSGKRIFTNTNVQSVFAAGLDKFESVVSDIHSKMVVESERERMVDLKAQSFNDVSLSDSS